MPYLHKFIKLTPEQRKKVMSALKTFLLAGKSRKRKRLQSIYLSNDGMTFGAISKFLRVSYRAVQKWAQKFREEGLEPFLK